MSRDNALNRRHVIGGAALMAGALAASQAGCAAVPEGKAFAGQFVFITGTSSGFGRLAAEHFARAGAHVFATMRRLPRPEAEELRALASRDRLKIDVLELDVRKDAEVEAAMKAALAVSGGRLDVLINNAGLGISGPVEVQDMTATIEAFDTNVFGVQRVLRAALPAMRARKRGVIFNISSQLGRLIVPGVGHYSATKFALEALSEQLAYELVPRGIDVCILQPGGYPTKVWQTRNTLSNELKARTATERLNAYPEFTPQMGTEDGAERTTDPMDVPRAMAEIAAMPAGTRPLRRAVHPNWRPQEAINDACREEQLKFLGDTPYGPLLKAALD